MSDPYNNQYNQYPSQNQYGGHSPAPSGGYGAPPQYNQQQQGGYDPHYSNQQSYNQGYATQGQNEFGPPRRQDSYGPPAAGGFQHGFEGHQVGAYDASNPQGNGQYYGQQQYPGYAPEQHGQMQPYQEGQYQGQPGYDQNNQGQYRDGPGGPPGSDFNPGGAEGAEGERGLGSALAGGAAGYFLGHKKNHGFLGAIGGAIAGNYIGNKLKEHGGHHGHHGHHGGGFGGSSWGGSGRW